MEANVPEALTVFHLPEKHRRRLRTTNALERLVTALLMEQSELWETDKTYLNMEN
jgi:hypothetical protein